MMRTSLRSPRFQNILVMAVLLWLANVLWIIMWAQPILPPTGNTPLYGGVRQNTSTARQTMGQDINTPENILIILDSSYSMIEPLQGRETKMAVAKRTILQVLQNVPPHVNVGLRVYGTDDTSAFTACRATDLLVPIGPNNRNLVASKLIGIKPTGRTPISYTLSRAIQQDFYGLPGKKSIILVSDGEETCSVDPCGVAVNMMRQGIDVKINVVGFGIQDMAAVKQLRCIALSTFGHYYTANTAAELADHLGRTLNTQKEVQGRILGPGHVLDQGILSSPKPKKPKKPENR